MNMTCLSYHKRLVLGPRNLPAKMSLCFTFGKLFFAPTSWTLYPIYSAATRHAECMRPPKRPSVRLWKNGMLLHISGPLEVFYLCTSHESHWPFFGTNRCFLFKHHLAHPKKIWWTDNIDIKECWEKMAMFNHDLVSKESSQKCQLHSIQEVLLRKPSKLAWQNHPPPVYHSPPFMFGLRRHPQSFWSKTVLSLISVT